MKVAGIGGGVAEHEQGHGSSGPSFLKVLKQRSDGHVLIKLSNGTSMWMAPGKARQMWHEAHPNVQGQPKNPALWPAPKGMHRSANGDLLVPNSLKPLTPKQDKQYEKTGKLPPLPTIGIRNGKTVVIPAPAPQAKAKAAQAIHSHITGGHGGNGGGGFAPGAGPLPQTGKSPNLFNLMKQGGHVGTPIDVNKVAQATADAQYGPVIAQLLQQQIQAPLQTKQNIADINNWYGNAGDNLKKASSREQTQNKQALQSLQNIGQGIISSIGGSDNQGSSAVGEVAQQGANTEQAIGSIQQNSNDQLRELMQQAQGNAVTQQQNSGQQLLINLANQIAQAQGQRGSLDTTTAAQLQQQNNGLEQQDWQNRLGVAQAISNQQAAAQANAMQQMLMGGTLGMDQARTGVYQTAALKNLAQAKNYANGGGGSWAKLSPSQRASLAAQLVASINQHGGGNDITGASSAIQHLLASYSLNAKNPQVRTWLTRAVLPGIGIKPQQMWPGMYKQPPSQQQQGPPNQGLTNGMGPGGVYGP